MAALFTKAAEIVRVTKKTCWGSVGQLTGVLGAAALGPAVLAGSGHLGYAFGQGVRGVSQGYVPNADEISISDETAEYNNAIEDIKRRVMLNRIKKQQGQIPSNRRIF